jgi:hypothetical protein
MTQTVFERRSLVKLQQITYTTPVCSHCLIVKLHITETARLFEPQRPSLVTFNIFKFSINNTVTTRTYKNILTMSIQILGLQPVMDIMGHKVT